jgi:hypothetical protein
LQSMKGRNCSEDNIKMDLKEVARRVWIGFMYLMIRIGGRLLWTQ